jgi:hypothetical protein
MSKRKKRNKKYQPNKAVAPHKDAATLPEEERETALKKVAKIRPNFNNPTAVKGKSQDTQNLRRGNR